MSTYKAKLWLNDRQYLAVLDEALVIVTVDEDGKFQRAAIFQGSEQKHEEAKLWIEEDGTAHIYEEV